MRRVPELCQVPEACGGTVGAGVSGLLAAVFCGIFQGAKWGLVDLREDQASLGLTFLSHAVALHDCGGTAEAPVSLTVETELGWGQGGQRM